MGNRSGGRYTSAGAGLSLAFEFAGAVFLFWFFGRLVDNWLGTEPWAQIIGSLLGWVGGFLHVYYATKTPDRFGPRAKDRSVANGDGR